jgi:hypothetical protein
MDRHTRVLEKYTKNKEADRKNATLFSARKEVNINGGGTSGYIVKNGPNKGKILGHYSPKANNNW